MGLVDTCGVVVPMQNCHIPWACRSMPHQRPGVHALRQAPTHTYASCTTQHDGPTPAKEACMSPGGTCTIWPVPPEPAAQAAPTPSGTRDGTNTGPIPGGKGLGTTVMD
eukprot:CAMPEP_0202923628 /NCGR_PEP_ID=MMETSP1392-20130828/78549_1 /ASSEMBLY_ACC=CAM_ASM_000868 /TAXON_ID=225041 /ORGANISM="Chlamydomonas chlamydogama, Strain SAG 11-48b" /LENGTH=108 /DNA_ID=CAMNT_0049617321 /DNA_START=2501 /DNA_END=2828 /DNA_ORIENTATION=-